MLARALAYCERRFGVLDGLTEIKDHRKRPQIPTGLALKALFLMFFGRFGSLHALEQTQPSPFWARRFGRCVPSADTLGRVASGVEPDRIRERMWAFYRRMKESKALPAPVHGLMTLVVDGHESTSSDLRCCPACLERVIDTAAGKKTQHYHRYVGGLLVGKDVEVWLDLEPQRKGEDEVAAAIRLVERVHGHMPRAFDVVAGDGLYAQARFFRAVQALGKDVVAVLKREELHLTREVRSLCAQVDAGTAAAGKGRTCRYWDFEHLLLGEGDGVPVRVVRTIETKPVRRQRTRVTEEVTSEWMWATTLEKARATAGTVIAVGHRRWAIENEGFNQISRRWQLDHVYRHDPVAIETLTLLGMLAANVGQTFYARDLKPELQARTTLMHVVHLIAVGIRVGAAPRSASP